MTSVMQFLVTFSALVIAACAGFLTYWNVREHRNADLVKIGVSVLRVDPDKEKQVSALREWALDLIDANAGGVKFSSEARAQLLRGPFEYYSTLDSADVTYPLEKPTPSRPVAEPPK